MLPDDMLRSEAWRTLPHSARSTLVVLAAQYAGRHNGIQVLTPRTCAAYGISRSQASRDATVLIERGLIERTCPGGKKPRPPTQYAVGWRDITHRWNEILDRPERAPNRWATWAAAEKTPVRPTQRDGAQSATSDVLDVAFCADDTAADVAQNANLLRSRFGARR
jgi:hypothetical protein